MPCTGTGTALRSIPASDGPVRHDRRIMNAEIYHASKKRLLLSWDIDFLLFMTLWELLSYFLSLDASVPFWAPYLMFLVIRAISGKYIGSIGNLFLGIDKASNGFGWDGGFGFRSTSTSLRLVVLLLDCTLAGSGTPKLKIEIHGFWHG